MMIVGEGETYLRIVEDNYFYFFIY